MWGAFMWNYLIENLLRRETATKTTCPVRRLTRWDEKAGLRGMRYAPNVSTCSGTKNKETGDEED